MQGLKYDLQGFRRKVRAKVLEQDLRKINHHGSKKISTPHLLTSSPRSFVDEHVQRKQPLLYSNAWMIRTHRKHYQSRILHTDPGKANFQDPGRLNAKMISSSVKQPSLPSITRGIQLRPNDSPASQDSGSPKPSTVTGSDRAQMRPSKNLPQVNQSCVCGDKCQRRFTRRNDKDRRQARVHSL